MNTLNKVIVFGATSEIAEQALRQLVSEGASVYCVARDEQRLETLLTDLSIRAGEQQTILGSIADLSDFSSHDTLWASAKAALQGCDGVLIAHGHLPNQSACEQSAQQTLDNINLNAMSIISLLTPIANHMQQQQYGVIAVISSVAGDRGRQSNYVYGAAKGMLSVFLQGLRNRLHQHKVAVVTIKPGFTRTRMTEGMNREGFLWADAADVGAGIVGAMRKGKDEVYLKPIWRLIMWVIKMIPEYIFKRLSL